MPGLFIFLFTLLNVSVCARQLYPDYQISHKGDYICYRYGSVLSGDQLVIKSENSERTFSHGFNAHFTSATLYFQLPGDTLVAYDLAKNIITYFPHILDYTLAGDSITLHSRRVITDPGRRWSAYLKNDSLYTGGRLIHTGVSGGVRFSPNGSRLYFQLRMPVVASPPKHIKVWSYTKYFLEEAPGQSVTCVQRLSDGLFFQVNTDSTEICYYGNRYVLEQPRINSAEYYWNKRRIARLWLVDTETGHRRMIRSNSCDLLLQPILSPDEHYVSWYEDVLKKYFVYEINTGRTIAFSGNITWLPNDLLIRDDGWDLWEIDLLCQQSKSLTKGYGRKHRIIFRYLQPGLFIAFNSRNKQNGYWGLRSGRLVKFTMQDALYYFPQYPLDRYVPTQAKDTGIFLVQRQSPSAAPNLYLTTDFKTFKKMTEFSTPLLLTAELVRHKNVTGILYKPLSFHPQKKYPLIFTYYEKSSDMLNVWLSPALSTGPLNIPLFVSQGYLVFVPDIRTQQGHPGRSAARTVLAAADYLCRYPWVDKQRLGLQGFSFGGYITNYIITHSTRFAAAQETAGPVDFISGYGAIREHSGTGMQALYEKGQNNMGVTPWERPDLYVGSSPVFGVQRVTTPLLMLHNAHDNNVPAAQAIEFFTALRRLQKPVWLLQYEDEGHQLLNDQSRKDFSIRQQEFFDHFLKGAPMPDWMHDQ